MKINRMGNKNAIVIEMGNIYLLVSYETPVAYLHRNTGIAYKTEKKWSATTSRHINDFLAEYAFGKPVHEVPQMIFDNLMDVPQEIVVPKSQPVKDSKLRKLDVED